MLGLVGSGRKVENKVKQSTNHRENFRSHLKAGRTIITREEPPGALSI